MKSRVAALALILTFSWLAARLASQAAEPAKASESKPATSHTSEAISPVEAALDQPIDLNFIEIPRKDVAADLTARLKINVVLDHKVLAEANVSEDGPVTFQLKDVSLRRALHWMLRPTDMDYVVADRNVLLLTTSEKAKATTVVRLYDVRDLLIRRAPDDGAADTGMDDLVAMLTSCVAPQSWDSAGGSGTITPQQGILAIAQTDLVQAQVAAVLESLRRVRSSPGAVEPLPADPDSAQPAAAAIRAKLARRRDIRFNDQTPLTDVRDWLSAQGIPALLDAKSLTEASIALDTPLAACDLKNVSLDWALRWLLNQRGMAWIIDGELLVITTAEEAQKTTCRVVYPIGDLAEPAVAADAEAAVDFDTLIDVLTSTIEPSTWSTAGGIGNIAPVPSINALVVDQTAATQDQIASLIAGLRAQLRAGAHPATKASPPDNGPLVRIYALTTLAAGEQYSIAAASRAERYVSVVRDLIEPKSWTDGSGYIEAVPGRIIVRQTPEVQKRVRKLLEQLGAVSPLNQGVFQPAGGHSGPSTTGLGGPAGGGAFDTDARADPRSGK